MLKARFIQLVTLGLCLSISLLSSSNSWAQVEKSPLDIEVIKETLPNGLTLVMNPDHRVPTVAIEVRYMVGSGHERAGRSGFAHLFEHLMFQGSKNYDQEYFTPFTPIGGKVNGTTNTDRTNYFEQVPAEALELALWMESDRMEGLLAALTQEKLDNQRDVVKNERRQRYENTPYGMVWKLFSNHLFPQGHPYQHTTIGSHEDLTAATLDDVKAFFKQYYVPANAIITLVGDFEPKEARQLVNKYFGHLASGQRAQRPQFDPIPNQQRQVITYQDRVKLPRVYFAWHTPALYQAGDAEMDLLASLLTSGKTSALYRPLVFEKQIAKEVFAFQVSQALGSYFVVGATAAPGQDLDALSVELEGELMKTLSGKVSKQNFTRALNEWRKSFYSRVESVMDRAHQLSTYEHLLGHPNRFSFDLERYTKLSSQQVMTSANTWLKGSEPLVIRVVPEATQAVIDRSAPPKLTSAKEWTPPTVEEKILSNGLKVWLVEQKQSPLISLQLIFNHGANSDQASQSGLAWLMANLLDEGAGQKNALEVSDALRLLATDYGASVYNDFTTLSMDLLAETLKPSLDLLADFVLRPQFNQKDFERVKKQRVASAVASRANPRASRNRVMMRTLFAKGYAGLPSNGLPQTIESLTLADVKSAYQSLIKPKDAVLIVVGKVDIKTLSTELERVFGAWQGPAQSTTRQPVAGTYQGAVHWVDFPESTQSAIAMVRQVDPKVGPQAMLQDELFNLVFGGKFTSRLNLNLREDKGYTYGAYSGVYRYKKAGMHYLGAMVKADQTLSSLKEMIAEIDGISSKNPIRQEEIDLMLTGELKGYPAQFEERSGVLGTLSEIHRQGFNSSWLKNWMVEWSKLDLAGAKNSANKIAQSKEYSIIIAGDQSKYLESIKALGRPIYFYNADGELISEPSQTNLPKEQPAK
mgnify:CR=1 FL=1